MQENGGSITGLAVPDTPQSNGLAERSVRTVKTLWSKTKDKMEALLSYRATPLSFGHSLAELMFGRDLRSPLGKPPNRVVDYSQFEETARNSTRMDSSKWDAKHRSGTFPELVAGQRMYVKAPSDVGREGVIVRKNNNLCSWWVKVGDSVVRRNQKHLFVLDHQNEEPRNSSAFLGFGESISYNLINPVRRAFKFKSPVDSSTELDYATNSASHSHISDSKDISSSNPEGGDGNGEIKGTVEGQVLSRQSDDSSSEEPRLEEAEAPSPVLETRLIEKNLRKTANLRGMYIPARVDRLNLSERTACIIINVCSKCCWVVRITSFL